MAGQRSPDFTGTRGTLVAVACGYELLAGAVNTVLDEEYLPNFTHLYAGFRPVRSSRNFVTKPWIKNGALLSLGFALSTAQRARAKSRS